MRPSLFFRPAIGFGGNLVFFDDRVFDEARAVRVNLTASTEGKYGLVTNYQDDELLDFTFCFGVFVEPEVHFLFQQWKILHSFFALLNFRDDRRPRNIHFEPQPMARVLEIIGVKLQFVPLLCVSDA